MFSMQCLNPSGGQAVLSVWNGVRRVSDSGSEEPRPLHLRHEVSPSGVADQPSLFPSGPVSASFGFVALLKSVQRIEYRKQWLSTSFAV